MSNVAASTEAKLGGYATAVATASNSSLNTTALEQVYRVQHDLMFSKNITLGETLTIYFEDYGYFLSAYWLLFPFSRGSVHLSKASQTNKPVIDPRYFLVDFDMDQEVAIGKQAHTFWHTSPMGDYITVNVTADPTTDAEWVDYIANSCMFPVKCPGGLLAMFTISLILQAGKADNSCDHSPVSPNYHPVGTAAMMSRELGGVVDSELRVYGTSNVRVVDASILPLQVSGHPTATLYAVAERISDVIRGRACI